MRKRGQEWRLLPTEHPQDDLLLVIVLARYSYDFEQAEPGNASRAWQLTEELAELHGLNPADAVTSSSRNNGVYSCGTRSK